MLNDLGAIAIGLWVLLPEIEEQQDSSYGDGTIGHIECGEGPAAVIDLDEIGYGLVDDAVIQIAGCAAQDE